MNVRSHIIPKGSKYHYSRSLVGVWAPRSIYYTITGTLWDRALCFFHDPGCCGALPKAGDAVIAGTRFVSAQQRAVRLRSDVGFTHRPLSSSLFGIILKDSKYKPQKGTTLGAYRQG